MKDFGSQSREKIRLGVPSPGRSSGTAECFATIGTAWREIKRQVAVPLQCRCNVESERGLTDRGRRGNRERINVQVRSWEAKRCTTKAERLLRVRVQLLGV